MFERIRRGWELAKASAGVLAADRELLVFPLVSGLATLLVVASFAVPMVMTQAWDRVGDDVAGRVVAGVVAWCFYFATSLVTIFFNTALVGAALERLGGGDPTVSSGLAVARQRIGPIVGWAAVSATVGLLLKAFQGRNSRLRGIVATMVGIAWQLATFLVVPVLAARGLGPIAALKESASLLRRTWGEQIVGAGGIGIVQGLATVATLLVGAPLAVLAASRGIGSAIAVSSLVLLAVLAINLIGSALQGVYSAALYRYATTGDGGWGFERSALEGAFRSRA